MSTPRDEERRLSDSSATDGMGIQMGNMHVHKQLAIENPFAEEHKEDQEGDSVGLDVSQEKTELDPAPVKEANGDKEGIDDRGKIDNTSKGKVCPSSDMPQPGGTVLKETLGLSTTKKREEDTMQSEETGIAKTQQEASESPPTYEESTDNIPEPESLPEAVEKEVDKVGANNFHLFCRLMEKDAKLPEGDFAFNCCCLCCCGRSCGKSRKCVMGYQFNKIKVASVKEGPTTAAIQWNDRKHPNVTLLFKSMKVTISIFLFFFSLCNFSSKIYQSTQKGQILFDLLATLVSFIWSLVSALALIVFLVRRREELIRSWRRIFLFMNALSTADDGISLNCCEKICSCCDKGTKAAKDITVPLGDRMKGSRCCGCWITQLQRLNRLKTTRGKWITIVGNFSEIILTVFEEIISTVDIVLSLYTFIGKQQYRVFYIVTELSEITTIIMIILSFFLFLISHIDRIIHIVMNILKFDEDIAELPEKKLKRNCCQRLFGFQGRLVIHAILLSLLQVYCLLALAWKIIRDHCISEEEARTTIQTTVIDRTVFNSTLPTVFEFGPLRGCSVPSLQPATVNISTMYNIFYVTMLLPILSYLLLFVSNMPFFVEYCQLLHASGMYKFERAIEESDKEEAEKGVTPHTFLEILGIFFNVLNSKGKFSEEDFKKKKKELKKEREKIQEDVINGAYAAFEEKIRAVTTFPPTVILGVFHFVLFFLHIGLLACRYSPQFGFGCLPILFDNLSVFTQIVPADVLVIILPAIILFYLTGFPGLFVTMMWIGTLIATVAIALMAWGLLALIFPLAFVMALKYSCN